LGPAKAHASLHSVLSLSFDENQKSETRRENSTIGATTANAYRDAFKKLKVVAVKINATTTVALTPTATPLLDLSM